MLNPATRFTLPAMQRLQMLALATLLSSSALGVQAQTVINGDFSTGLAGWQVIGDASVPGGSAPELWLSTASADFEDDFPLPAGALNRSGQGATGSDGLEAFVGLTAGMLDPDPQAGLQAYEGSAALQSFSAGVGDTLSFHWDFGTSDSFADYAFVIIDGQMFRLAGSADAARPGRLGNLFQTGPQSFSLSFTSGGTHTLAFGVVDVGDYSVTSTLAVAGVQVTAVPEPGALALMLAGVGLAALGGTRRRRSNH